MLRLSLPIIISSSIESISIIYGVQLGQPGSSKMCTIDNRIDL